MDREKFETIDPMLDQLADVLDDETNEKPWLAIKQRLAEISALLGEEYSVTLEVKLQVHEFKREQSLPLVRMGFTTSNGAEPCLHCDDSSPQRYVVNGSLVIVPHDNCPACWGVWDFKELHPACSHCCVRMGQQVKLVLDNDNCPHCEQEITSMSNPTCSRCGHTVNPAFIYWG